MRIVICDLDGTLANIDHRLHYVRGKAKDWDSFFAKIPSDAVHEPVLNLLWALRTCYDEKYQIFYVSGRPERTRLDTKVWLLKHCQISINSASPLFMRADGDFRPDTVVKSEILDEILSEGHEVVFAIDDRPSVVQMWRNRGIFVFHVNGDRWEGESDYPPGLLTLMVGPSGAGKSSFLQGRDSVVGSAYGLGILESQIVSTDNLREELCGNFMDQTKNDQVFSALRKITRTRIQSGLDCVVDATNLHRKDRMELIQTSGASQIRYLVLDRPLGEKIATRDWRPIELIEKHHGRFQSGLPHILAGDDLPNVEVIDLRRD